MRRAFLVAAAIGILVVVAVRRIRLHVSAPRSDAYVGVQGATVWNSLAEVRVPKTTLNFGEHVQIYERSQGYVEIDAPSGVRGWVSSGVLLDPSVWRDAESLDRATRVMPVEARGHTRVRSNLHTRPGRNAPVILQAFPNTPVVLLERKTAPVSAKGMANDGWGPAKRENWWLVRARVKATGEVAGWLLGQFVRLDLPEALAQYENSQAMKIVAWFRINQAVGSSGGLRPEYLVMGRRGGEGQPCDFQLVRVYTWDPVQGHYVTAFLQNGLCGSLPVSVNPARVPGGEAHFAFRNVGLSGEQNRAYEMKNTHVWRTDKPLRRGKG